MGKSSRPETAVYRFYVAIGLLAIEMMKDEFISVVSHELRTPLTSIRGAQVSSPTAAEADETIASGTVKLTRDFVVAGDLVMQAVEIVRSIADRAGVQLIAKRSDDIFYADPDRVVQTLTNLISNAVKFSERETTVMISANAAGDDIRFDVVDEGRGVRRENLESIFERFQQVDASDSRVKGGTGLGLAICRSIVTQHGGTIWVESEPVFGSRFSFTLPRSIDAESVARFVKSESEGVDRMLA